MKAATAERLQVTCAGCGVILERGRVDEDGGSSSGFCPPCLESLYGELGAQVARSAGPHEDQRRRRAIAERLAELQDAGVQVWTREDEPILWIRARTSAGLELVRAELLARDAAGNWFVLSTGLESRSFSPAEVESTSLET